MFSLASAQVQLNPNFLPYAINSLQAVLTTLLTLRKKTITSIVSNIMVKSQRKQPREILVGSNFTLNLSEKVSRCGSFVYPALKHSDLIPKFLSYKLGAFLVF